MRHLTKEQLLDLAESAHDGVQAGHEASAHMQSCGFCRTEVDELRSLMALSAQGDVPDPSPLYWTHFSARVREAVAAEGQPAPRAWANWRVLIPLASFALLLAAAITLAPTSPPREGIDQSSEVTAGRGVSDVIELAPLSDDASLSVLADLTSDLDWDTATEAGFSLRAGAVDDLVSALTTEERQELGRLLQEELAHSGA